MLGCTPRRRAKIGEDAAPQSSPQPSKTPDEQPARRTVGDVLAMVVDSWSRPLSKSDALRLPSRFAFAFAGAAPWLYIQLLLNPVGLSLVMVNFPDLPRSVIEYGVPVVFGGWFAALIAYQDRRCAPSRFFLEGLLLPAITAGLLTSGASVAEWLGD